MFSATETGPFIRKYQVGDLDAAVYIFRETAHASLRALNDPVLTYGEHVWCRPYLVLEPESAFMLDDGSGKPVGYIFGTWNTKRFVDQWRGTYLPLIASDGPQEPGPDEDVEWKQHNVPNALRSVIYSPENLLHEHEPSLIQHYPAHLHIDILPAYQRKGWGRQMMQTFLHHLTNCGADGVHLVRAGDNDAADAFYERVGLGRYPGVLDDGVSGERGRMKDSSVWHAKKLPPT